MIALEQFVKELIASLEKGTHRTVQRKCSHNPEYRRLELEYAKLAAKLLYPPKTVKNEGQSK